MRRLALAAFVFMLPLMAHAQYALPGFQGAVRISIDPLHPSPDARVRLTLESSLVDIDASTVTWRIGGKIVQGSGKTLITQTGELGSKLSISAEVRTPEGSLISAQTDILPTAIDLLYESDSYTPPFYGGRALPSAGSSVRLHAITHFVKSDGSTVASRDIEYTWKRNDRVLSSQSGLGRASITVDAPHLFGTDSISVEAVSKDGTYAGSASVTIPSVEPVLRLYLDHPLYGLRLDQAVASTTVITDREMTFAVIPYFVTARSPLDPGLLYDWLVDSRPIDSAADTRNELTLGAPDGGEAHLAVSLSHVTNIFLSAQESWSIFFTTPTNTDSPFINP